MAKKVTRAKVLKTIPLSFGIIQNIADYLCVTRSAVSKFLSLPENQDIKEMLKDEEGRMWDYAKMNIGRTLLTGDFETARWFLTHFPDGSYNPAKKHKALRPNFKNEKMVNFDRDARKLRRGIYYSLVYADNKRTDTNNKLLPGRLKFPEPENKYDVPKPLLD